jgi:hypothetical protein
MTAILDKPAKEEKILVHSEAKFLGSDDYVIYTTPIYNELNPENVDEPDKLIERAWGGNLAIFEPKIAEELDLEYSSIRFFKPGTVMNIDPYF